MIDISKFLTWNELCDRWKLKDIELFEYLKMGLPLYIKCRNPVPCLGKYHRYRFLQERQNSILKPTKIENYLPDDFNSENNVLPNDTNEDYEKAKNKALGGLTENLRKEYLKIENEMLEIDKDDPNHISWKYFEMPSSDWEIEDLIEDLKDYYFKVEDVAKFENRMKQDSENKINIMFNQVGSQIENLYSIFLKKFSSWPGNEKKELRQYVIDHYNKNRDSFNFIKIKWLREESLYIFNRERHARDDFIGRLLLKAAVDWDLERNNVQEICNEYKKFKKSAD